MIFFVGRKQQPILFIFLWWIKQYYYPETTTYTISQFPPWCHDIPLNKDIFRGPFFFCSKSFSFEISWSLLLPFSYWRLRVNSQSAWHVGDWGPGGDGFYVNNIPSYPDWVQICVCWNPPKTPKTCIFQSLANWINIAKNYGQMHQCINISITPEKGRSTMREISGQGHHSPLGNC